MTVLVTGGTGTIGKALREFLPDAIYLGRKDCDITNDRQLNEVFQQYQPTAVIHAAALTDHQHPDSGEIIAVNVIGTERVARYCRAFGAKLVYLSTHYVYPGVRGDYKETDETRPVGTYAWSKLAGEGWARLPDEWLIVRGSWYTFKTRLEKWLTNGALTDAYCSRESAREAAAKIAELVKRDATGVYNIGGEWRSFYQICLDEKYGPRPLRRRDLKLPYEFPQDSSVSTAKYEAFIAAGEKFWKACEAGAAALNPNFFKS